MSVVAGNGAENRWDNKRRSSGLPETEELETMKTGNHPKSRFGAASPCERTGWHTNKYPVGLRTISVVNINEIHRQSMAIFPMNKNMIRNHCIHITYIFWCAILKCILKCKWFLGFSLPPLKRSGINLGSRQSHPNQTEIIQNRQ